MWAEGKFWREQCVTSATFCQDAGTNHQITLPQSTGSVHPLPTLPSVGIMSCNFGPTSQVAESSASPRKEKYSYHGRTSVLKKDPERNLLHVDLLFSKDHLSINGERRPIPWYLPYGWWYGERSIHGLGKSSTRYLCSVPQESRVLPIT